MGSFLPTYPPHPNTYIYPNLGPRCIVVLPALESRLIFPLRITGSGNRYLGARRGVGRLVIDFFVVRNSFDIFRSSAKNTFLAENIYLVQRAKFTFGLFRALISYFVCILVLMFVCGQRPKDLVSFSCCSSGHLFHLLVGCTSYDTPKLPNGKHSKYVGDWAVYFAHQI